MRPPLLLACLLLSACDLAPTPPAEPEAEPAAAATREATQRHELQQAIDSVDHRDKAAAAGDPVLEADRKREQDLEDSGG